MKEGLKVYTPFQLAAFRLVLAGTALLPFIPKKSLISAKKDLGYFALSGLLGNGIPAFLFATAQTRIPSALSGALNTLTPLFVLIAGAVVFRVNLRKNQYIGVLVGLVGALLILFGKFDEINWSNNGYSILIIAATICYGINVNIIKYKLSNYRPIVVAAIPLFLMALASLPIILYVGLPQDALGTVNVKSTLAIVLLALAGTALGLIWFNRLIQQTNPIFASSTTYLIPIVALMWGLLDGEQIHFYQIVGLLIVLGAIWIINKKQIPN